MLSLICVRLRSGVTLRAVLDLEVVVVTKRVTCGD